MRRIKAAMAAVPALALLLGLTGLALLPAATPASAGTYLSEAAAAINRGHDVFAVASTPGYQGNIAPPPAPVVLVELPAIATAETGGNGQLFANQLNDLTHHQYIIGVAFVSSQTSATYYAATSRLRPGDHGTATQQMQAAAGIGQGPEDTLSTFGNNLRTWLQGNSLLPVHKPTTGLGSTGGHVAAKGVGFPVFLVVILIPLLLAGVAFMIWRRWLRSIPGLLSQLRKVQEQIGDFSTQGSVQNICSHIERYLARVHENLSEEQLRDARRSAMFNLQRILKVARGYVDMEQHPDEWPGDTGVRLRNTAASLSKFDADLVSAIKDANEGRLAELDVDTSVLEHSVM